MLTFSTVIRVLNIVWRYLLGSKFNKYLFQNAIENGYEMPLYFAFHFLLIDSFSLGMLLLNFGFAISNTTQVVKPKDQLHNKSKNDKMSRLQTHTHTIKRKRRETFLDVGDSSSDDEEENRENSNSSSSVYISTGGTDSGIFSN